MHNNIITFGDIYAGIKSSIRERDGKTHTLILRGHYDLNKLDKGSPFVIEDCTNFIDNTVSKMQDDGYEIIDIKPVYQVTTVICVFVIYK